MSEEESCSECRLEIIERIWKELLLNWVNKGIGYEEVKELSSINLNNVLIKYKKDICCDDFDKLTIYSYDFEFLMMNKFPISRLGNLNEENDRKRPYILMSLLLFYLCTNSNGQVDADICENLSNDEQVMILKFCEALSAMEVTINNIEVAIKDACEAFLKQEKCYTRRENEINSDLDPTSSLSSDYIQDRPIQKFKSSITVMPSVVADATERRSEESDLNDDYLEVKLDREIVGSSKHKTAVTEQGCGVQKNRSPVNDSDHHCQSDCACSRCSATGPCCGDPGCTKELCDDNPKVTKKSRLVNWKWYIIIGTVTLLLLIVFLSTIPVWPKRQSHFLKAERMSIDGSKEETLDWLWICQNNFCRRVFKPSSNITAYSSLSRCTLLCTGLQLWPYPIGFTYYSKTIITVTTKKLEYKFNSVPSELVQEHLSEAFKLFLKDLARLEKSKANNDTDKISVKKMIIQVDVESDSDPKLRLNTDEAYELKVETILDQVLIRVRSESFCGVRHGLETLGQLFLLDENMGHLITLSNIIIKDAPTYKYRGLMVDTARNYISVIDLMRTIDAMATCKLNTFHWRISDATSFPLHLKSVHEFLEFGPYDRSMVYTRDDVKLLVKRGGVRGVRILIEVAAPGPVGRPWSWLPETKCPRKINDATCNILCLRLSMKESNFDILERIYAEIIELTRIDDVFHLSDSIFSISNCYNLIDDRNGFLDKALDRLKLANRGFLPRLPIIWYTTHLKDDFEAKTWNRLGVQISNWDPTSFKDDLSKFKIIESSKWDLSCEIRKQRCTKYRSWQEMYAWKSWRNLEAFTIEGGESILWTDTVDSSNLDYHIWPRAAAVAERLWSDIVANSTANKFVYLRLDMHRWRMLLRGITVQPIWPAWCSYNPSSCVEKLD